jgi:hypothetical protein
MDRDGYLSIPTIWSDSKLVQDCSPAARHRLQIKLTHRTLSKLEPEPGGKFVVGSILSKYNDMGQVLVGAHGSTSPRIEHQLDRR